MSFKEIGEAVKMVSMTVKTWTEDFQVKICQQEIVRLDLLVQSLIRDVRDCQGPLSTLHALNSEARQNLNALKLKVEEFERLAKEQEKQVDEIALLRELDNHKSQLARSYDLLRKATVEVQARIESGERSSLFSTEASSNVRQRKKTDKENVAQAAAGVTDGLLNVSRMLASQVKQSDEAMSHLVSSSRQVVETHKELNGMAGDIQSSGRLLTKYGRREFTDKILIFIAIIFFFATVFYIVKKRLFGSTVVP